MRTTKPHGHKMPTKIKAMWDALPDNREHYIYETLANGQNRAVRAMTDAEIAEYKRNKRKAKQPPSNYKPAQVL